MQTKYVVYTVKCVSDLSHNMLNWDPILANLKKIHVLHKCFQVLNTNLQRNCTKKLYVKKLMLIERSQIKNN